MEFFKTNTKIQFMRQRKWATIFSIFIFLASLIALLSEGLALGLDFTGGTQLDISYPQAVEVEQVRDNLATAGFKQAIVQPYTSNSLSVRIPVYKGLSNDELKQKLIKALPNATINNMEMIGSQVSKTLINNGILAIILVLLGTMGYVALRFEYRFAVSAAVALIHDPVLILGIFSFFHLEFDLIVLTALLTVIGYSLNDTIVVYDRVRENFRKVRKSTPIEIMDMSINQTLSRTIMTSGLTFVVVACLFVFGGQAVHGFALAMMIGIVIGTYSSIYVAGSLAIALGLNRTHLQAPNKKIQASQI